MPRARTGPEVELEYETHGAREGRPLVLIRGLGTQLIQWPAAFLEGLVAAGHFVVVFDNRDVGLSTWFDHLGVPRIAEVIAALREGRPAAVPYTLDDMADDVTGLLDALELPSAHIAGMSMGGMLTQVMGYRHPTRVRSLAPVMATTGNRALPQAAPDVLRVLTTPPPRERAACIEHHVQSAKVFAGPVSSISDAQRAALAARVYDRAFHPEGTARQYAAILADGDRRERLRQVRAPTLVIHGSADPLVRVEGGRDTARHIEGAALLELEGMGHELPPPLLDQMVQAIAVHTGHAEALRTSPIESGSKRF